MCSTDKHFIIVICGEVYSDITRQIDAFAKAETLKITLHKNEKCNSLRKKLENCPCSKQPYFLQQIFF